MRWQHASVLHFRRRLVNVTEQSNSAAPLRRLLLLRHAKSAWPDGVEDHERPLAKRGQEAAPLMGNYLAQNWLHPDLVLVSSARRTRQTWALVRKALLPAIADRVVDEIYEAPAASLLEVIRTVEPGFETIMLIGHNPGMQDLALELIGDGDEETRAAISEKYPTAALAVIDFTTSRWDGIEPGSGRLERFVAPRMLA